MKLDPESKKRLSSNAVSLFKVLQSQHRGAGGAAMCICGAGCGGTPGCSALSMLKTALARRDDDEFVFDVMQAFGWEGYYKHP